LGFTPFLKKGPSGKTHACCGILCAVPDLPVSGLLSQLRLLAQLCSYDFIQTATPCLFRHRTRDIAFCLVVDDFAIRCKNLEDLQHFAACLGELCHVKVHPDCVSCFVLRFCCRSWPCSPCAFNFLPIVHPRPSTLSRHSQPPHLQVPLCARPSQFWI
jgi:hypothetical protein